MTTATLEPADTRRLQQSPLLRVYREVERIISTIAGGPAECAFQLRMIDEAAIEDTDLQPSLPHAQTVVIVVASIIHVSLIEQTHRINCSARDQHADEADHTRLFAKESVIVHV